VRAEDKLVDAQHEREYGGVGDEEGESGFCDDRQCRTVRPGTPPTPTNLAKFSSNQKL
jgi:hypothetical protein